MKFANFNEVQNRKSQILELRSQVPAFPSDYCSNNTKQRLIQWLTISDNHRHLLIIHSCAAVNSTTNILNHLGTSEITLHNILTIDNVTRRDVLPQTHCIALHSSQVTLIITTAN